MSRHLQLEESANDSARWMHASYSPTFSNVRVHPHFGGVVAAMRQCDLLRESDALGEIDDHATRLTAEHIVALWKDDLVWDSERFMNRVMTLIIRNERVTSDIVSELIEGGEGDG